jgi:hypothetical protein
MLNAMDLGMLNVLLLEACAAKIENVVPPRNRGDESSPAPRLERQKIRR